MIKFTVHIPFREAHRLVKFEKLANKYKLTAYWKECEEL